ncbi:MAG: polysaccharide deacetylase family protein [Actinobacteria bacterium]|nr:polysaccharide deacetylase family protein [Actinomycetota bacterium]
MSKKAVILLTAALLATSLFLLRFVPGTPLPRALEMPAAKKTPSSIKSPPKKETANKTIRPAPPDPAVAYREKLERIGRKRLHTEVERGDVKDKVIAFTFDAGASAEAAPAILDALKKKGLRVTFFLTGKWVEQNPALARRIASEGHEIGNHTYTHPQLTPAGEDVILAELTKTEELIRKTTGVSSKPFFRAPFGARDQRVIDVAAKAGYFSVFWTVDSLDWKEGISEGEVKERILSAVSPGAIILSHVGSPAEARVFPQMIDEITGRGYRIVRLSDVLND